jgi:exopolyphosphatase/guanosine-5'-triphosphate,3'-diphosphate pyrophosphatase
MLIININKAERAMVSCKHWKNGHCKDCTKNCPIKKKLGQLAAQKAAQKQPAKLAFPLANAALQAHLAHGRRVQQWSLLLFAALREVHRLPESYQEVLGLAAYLHDIGWAQGHKKHHKRSQRMILDNAVLPIASEIRPLVALVARYHRKADPSMKHKVFAALTNADRKAVVAMASLLRLADALEYSHSGAIASITACVQGKVLVISAQCTAKLQAEAARVEKKSILFTALFGLNVQLNCVQQ